MNEKLNFSWGHIIAFIALIIISYVSFMGYTYLTNGNFTYALIGMGITDVLFMIVFIGAQQLKASGYKMKRKIIWERILIFGSPLVFIGGMVAMSHFWTVQSRNDEVVEVFKSSINSSKQLFDNYEEYANARIDAYQETLNRIIARQSVDPRTFQQAGFESWKAPIQKDNMVETLRLQLLSENYEQLKKKANEWIDNASASPSTWNVFLLGNTREIEEALNNWEQQLREISEKELSNEAIGHEVPKFTSSGTLAAIMGLDDLKGIYTAYKAPTMAAIIFGIVMYIMVLFPYFVQARNTKSPYLNIFQKRKIKSGFTLSDEPEDDERPSTNHNGTFIIED